MKAKIIHDPALPALSRAMDPAAMREAFARRFQTQYPGRIFRVDKCRIERVYHKPGKRCQITYRLQCSDGPRQAFEQWFLLALMAKDPHQYLQGRPVPKTWPGCDFWSPLSVWDDMRALLYAFPYDPKMPYLGQLLDVNVVTAGIDTFRSEFGLDGDWRCRNLAIKKFKYRAGKSCVLRYTAEMIHKVSDNRMLLSFFGKTYNSPRSAYVYEVLRQVSGHPAFRGSGCHVPRPLAHIAEANTLWQEAWEGEKLREAGERLGWRHFLSSDDLPRIARLLAALHRVEMQGVSLNEGVKPPEMLANMRLHGEDILRHVPEKAREVAAMLELLAQNLPNDHGPRCTIHGSFKIAQLLYREGEFALIDFDSIAYGDPHYDLGEFIASVIFLQITDDIPAGLVEENLARLLQAYDAAAPWESDPQRLAWHVSGFLLGKIHSLLKKLKAAHTGKAGAALELAQAWAARSG